MGTLVIRVGGRSVQGRRPNNEDCYVADPDREVFLVADGMGGQEHGERASGMAAEIIPRVLRDCLAAQEEAGQAVVHALDQANQAIIAASRGQAIGRRMGTTAVLAIRQAGQVYVAGLGDSRAYLIRGDSVEQLTSDHTVADFLASSGQLTPEQARESPWRHVLYKFLGCAEMAEGPEVRPFVPQAGDRLILASDGLTGHVGADDLRAGAARYPDPQEWADALVALALERGSNDNVTCVVVAFHAE
jgi:serine/threonine protein phosphatase PrpC